MHKNTRNRVIINGSFNDDFLVQVGLHQDSKLSHLLHVIGHEVLSRQVRYECSESCFMLIIWDCLVT